MVFLAARCARTQSNEASARAQASRENTNKGGGLSGPRLRPTGWRVGCFFPNHATLSLIPMSEDPALHTESQDDAIERRREALLATLAEISPDTVETKFREFFDAGSGAWCDWDERFVALIERHRHTRLLAGKVRNDFFVVFSPEGRAGFWVFAQPGGGSGKGFLTDRDIEKLTALARQKSLI